MCFGSDLIEKSIVWETEKVSIHFQPQNRNNLKRQYYRIQQLKFHKGDGGLDIRIKQEPDLLTIKTLGEQLTCCLQEIFVN